MVKSEKIPIYFMPGLAASSAIFENIVLDESLYEPIFLEWIQPLSDEKLETYVKRLLQNVKHEDPILIGVSFGGIIVQEMAKYIKVRQLIIISSVLNENEFPRRMYWARIFKLYYLFPTRLISNFKILKYFMIGKTLKKRLDMYQKYLYMNDKKYLDWAFKTIINWKAKNNENLLNVIRVHGEKDEVFPLKNINTSHCYVIPKATHAMIVYKYKWFNKNLPTIIKQTKL